jgi:hypothetical protein
LHRASAAGGIRSPIDAQLAHNRSVHEPIELRPAERQKRTLEQVKTPERAKIAQNCNKKIEKPQKSKQKTNKNNCRLPKNNFYPNAS